MNMRETKAHLRYTLTVFLRRLAPGRNATVYPDDVFLVSYPKSGNTWMRFLVGNLLFPNEPIRFADVEKRMPSIYGMQNRKLELVSRPRYIKSHESFHSGYRNVIYIVRDPRDVAVSYFHFALKLRSLPPNSTIDSFVPGFVANKVLWPYGNWADHVMSWLAMRPSRRKFLFLRYEDLIADTRRELSKVALFLGIDPTPERLDHAVEMSTANRMRDLEKREWNKWSGVMRRSRRDVPFVRAAKTKQWTEALSAEAVASIENAWGPLMQALGYKLVSTPQQLQKDADTWRFCEAQVRALWPDSEAQEATPLALNKAI